jgi:hypothetical protein
MTLYGEDFVLGSGEVAIDMNYCAENLYILVQV